MRGVVGRRRRRGREGGAGRRERERKTPPSGLSKTEDPPDQTSTDTTNTHKRIYLGT